MAKGSTKKKRRRRPDLAAQAPAAEISRAPATEKAKAPVWISVFQGLLIVATVFWIYASVLHGDWLWDDDYLIQHNDLIHDPYGIWNIWLAPTTLIDFFPLTVSVEWLEWQLWPNNTFPYHLTNILFHAGSALLVWHLFRKLGLRLAWLGGLLFAVHPVMVESVAWMAELKNTLSMPPFLLALCAWIDYDRRGRLEDYLLSLGLFLVAMLCKTTMVMFPVIILLYAWWRRGRIEWKDLKDSLAFFAVSCAIGIALILLLRHGVGEETIPLGGFLSRVACSGLSIAFYFSKCFLPIDLLPIYPQWVVNPPTVWQLLPWPVLAAAIYWLCAKRESWARHVLFGFGFFLLNLIPFVGFRVISFMRFAWVMDHFLYLPILGLLGLAVAALGQMRERLSASARPLAIGTLVLVIALMAFGSHRYAKIFINSIAQWNYTLRRFPGAWPAHNNLGNALSDLGRLPEAKVEYEAALRINPGYPEAHNNLGIVFAKTGQVPEAIDQFEQALQLCPDLEDAQSNLRKVESWPKSNAPHP